MSRAESLIEQYMSEAVKSRAGGTADLHNFDEVPTTVLSIPDEQVDFAYFSSTKVLVCDTDDGHYELERTRGTSDARTIVDRVDAKLKQGFNLEQALKQLGFKEY